MRYIGNKPAPINVDSSSITDGSITDADINASAAIASSKLAFSGDTDFGANKITYSNVYSNLADLPSASTYHGMFAHVHATGKGYFAHGGNWIPIVNEDTSGNVSLGGDLTVTGSFTVNGTQTTINSTTMDVDDLNITVASGAANSAAADGAGITIDGAGVNFQYSDTGKYMSLNKTLQLDQAVVERVKYSNSTFGTINTDIGNTGTGRGAIVYNLIDATANRTLNINMATSATVDGVMAQGDVMTVVVIVKNGATAYYLNAFEIEGSAGQITVTPLWQGGSAPSGGNANSHDVYTFTVIKQATNQFQVLGSVSKFA